MLIKLGGVKKKTVYKVYWTDPTSHIDSEIGSMTERWNVGYIVKKKNEIHIVSAGFSDKTEKDKDFTVIHKSLITKIEGL